MKYSYSWLKDLYSKIPSPKDTADALTFHAFQVESVEKKGSDYLLDIDVLANRAADASGHLAIARELAVIGGGELKNPSVKLKEDAKTPAKNLLAVRIETKPVPRYSARVMTDIRVGESPKWMRERLTTCGLRPINVVVDVTNYVMLETGQPLHAFDFDRLRGVGAQKQIIVRKAKRGETMETLGDETQKLILAENDLVIADAKGPIGLAGIKGGKGSEIHSGMARIVLEAANFDATTIRKTSRRLNLRTDASWRFEHNISPEMTIYALDRAAELLAQYAGGRPAKRIVDFYPQKESLRRIPYRSSRAESLLGMGIPETVAVSILKRLGCSVKKMRAGSYSVTPPSIRRDLNIEEDLIEEIARMWGYDKMPAKLPLIRGGIAKKSNRQVFEDAIKDRLSGVGFTEIHLSSFIGERALKMFGLGLENLYQLENPTSPDMAFLVHIASIQFVRSVTENLYNFDSVKIFGIGRSFIKTADGPEERRSIIIALAERGKDGKEEFYSLKGTVDALLDSFGISDHWYDDGPGVVSRHGVWAHPGRVAEIKIGDNTIGAMGEISTAILERLKSKARIVLAEFDIEKLTSQIESEQEFRPIAKFPAIVRDIALVIPESARIQEVENTIQIAGGQLLVDFDMFDYYEGEGLPSGSKSVAFHLIFQSEERTLTDKEVEREFEKVVRAVKEKDWEVR